MNRDDTSTAASATASTLTGLTEGAEQAYSSDEISSALDRFGALLRAPMELPVLLQSVCAQIVATIPSADMAGVTILSAHTRKPETVACTDERALDVDIDQYRANEGPCLEAARTRQVVRVRIEDAVLRWPAFAQNVAGMGVASYLSAPLVTGEDHVGALNLYSYSDHGFTEIDEVLLQVFVAAVEGSIWNARRAQQWRCELEGLREAMKSRARIEQVKGMLMAVHAIGEEWAFEMLVEQSQQRNVRLAAVAAELVETLAHRK
ncbi:MULTISPECIES: GAF and ANTAR domain-containing protein [Rhodococcus erythropolis group]|uniref:GAF and ANTAR domain-containing protein n=1 Tax=Rhodococcus erythropolis group TaxID=2840174 RepID=UPI001BE8D398|nr:MULTISPECIES: GAF and ANTAR domain-containing protein [Rhodococcus erythropolis group]MBT2269667.1 GAF and ANTAR domain-containing protein [Rhodococcus erythropolis]MBT2274184.1 GAF and ANTAR domain-containing protein [Rhodococcus qingshengii]